MQREVRQGAKYDLILPEMSFTCAECYLELGCILAAPGVVPAQINNRNLNQCLISIINGEIITTAGVSLYLWPCRGASSPQSTRALFPACDGDSDFHQQELTLN